MRRDRKHRRPTGLLVAAALASVAVGEPLAPATFAQPTFRARHLDAATGLTHDRFNATFGTDSRGFHWIGSLHGAYRYDGQRLRHYSLREGEGLASIQSDFFEDRRGHVWFSTADALHRYDPHTDLTERFPRADGPASAGPGIHLIGYDREGDRLWLSDGAAVWTAPASTPAEGTDRVAVTAVRFLELPADTTSPTAPSARSFLALPWMLTPGLTRVRYDPAEPAARSATPTSDPYLATVTVSGAAHGPDGLTYLATSEGLLAYDATADRLAGRFAVPGAAGEATVWDVVAYDSLLLVASDTRGLWWFSPMRGRFVGRVTTTSGAVAGGGTPRSVYVDPHGVTFVMQAAGGVDVLAPAESGAAPVLPPEGYAAGAIAVGVDHGGDIYFVDALGRSSVARPPPRDHVGAVQAMPTAEVPELGRVRETFFATDPGGGLYLASGRRLYRREVRRGGSFVALAEADTVIRALTFPPDGAPLVALADGRYCRVGDDRLDCAAATAAAPEQRVARASVFDLGGGRLARRTPSGLVEVLASEPGAAPETESSFALGMGVYEIARAGRGDSLAIGGDNGLVLATRPSADAPWILTDAQYPDRDFYRVLGDERGGLWAVTSRGLGHGDASGRWAFWTAADGIPDDLDRHTALALSGDSVAWVATGAAAAYLPESAWALPPVRSRVHVDALWLDGLPAVVPPAAVAPADSLAAGLSLSYRHEALALRLGTTGIYDETPPTLRYRLRGLRERWRATGPEGTVELDRLPPGRYVLEAAAEDARGRTTPTLRLGIAVAPPYHQTWWFRLGLLAAFAAVVGGAAYAVSRRKLLRARQALERQAIVFAERERLARELHDDLGGTLANILFLSDDGDGDDDGAGGAQPIAQIADLSRSALANMRLIIHALDETEDGFGEFVGRVGDQARELCVARGIRCVVVPPDTPADRFPALGGALRKEVSLIVKEAVSNAVRHSGATVVTVGFRDSGPDELRVSVSDDGRGFDPSATPAGMGTGNMHLRAERLGARLTTVSAPGRGTTVSLAIPLA